MKRSSIVAVFSVQLLLVGVSILLGTVAIPLTALSILTILILLAGMHELPDTIPSIEELVEVKVVERTSILAAKMNAYERQASTDALTGLLNRRGGESAISHHISIANDQNRPLSFLLLDIDHFKGINDQYGHAVGDLVITAVATCLKNNLRASDISIRWGGEEYLMILPDTNMLGAVNTAEKIRHEVALLKLEQAAPVTVSIGCAELGRDDVAVVLARADMNLYFAKSKGRNKVFPDFDQNILDR